MWDNDEKDVSAALAVAKLAVHSDPPITPQPKVTSARATSRSGLIASKALRERMSAARKRRAPRRPPAPMSEAEAREKIEAFLARKGAALCPVRACAAVQNGTGFAL